MKTELGPCEEREEGRGSSTLAPSRVCLEVVLMGNFTIAESEHQQVNNYPQPGLNNVVSKVSCLVFERQM